ncbi:PKD domain-containing protein, partial [Methanoregula sp.]|uniref:PKD domain-containing protein n=1 Tax=Methanoregula sp. TaxID=2052170 RepID=UPI003C78F2C3
MTLTETPVACNGGTCTSGTTNGIGTAISAPVSAFLSNVTMVYFKQNPFVAVQFNAATNTPPYSWMWSWTGGTLSYVSDPTLVLVFNKYGYYTVFRTITNTLGASSNSTTISVCPLVASFTTSQATGLVPLTVQFIDKSTDQPTSWNWSFGDGGYSSLQNPTHRYTASGVYTVRLDTKNNLGPCWNTTTISVSPLVASFTPNLTSGIVPLTVQFKDTSTDQPTSWNWSFGDGGTSTLQNPVYTYMNYGTYTANLIASNGYDEPMSSLGILITVNSFPSVSFTESTTAGRPNTTVIFTDQSKGFPSPTSWYWDFGDGFNSTL